MKNKEEPGQEQVVSDRERRGEKILSLQTAHKTCFTGHSDMQESDRQLRRLKPASHSARRETNMLRKETHPGQEHPNTTPSQHPNTASKHSFPEHFSDVCLSKNMNNEDI